MNAEQCSICFENYENNIAKAHKRPIVLDCGHTICKSCFFGIYFLQDMRCPLCRKFSNKNFLIKNRINYNLIEIVNKSFILIFDFLLNSFKKFF